MSENSSENPISIWDQNAVRIGESLRASMQFFEDDPPEEIEEEFQKAYTRERNFVAKLSTTLKEADQHVLDQKLLVLFDIDETIGRVRYADDYKTFRTIIRPSVPFLLEHFRSVYDGIQFGLLSTRGQKSLEEQLTDPNQLGTIQEYISPEHVHSTTDLNLSEITSPYLPFLKKQSVVNKAKLDANPGIENDVIPGDLDKIRKLEEIKLNNPDTTMVVVDDFMYPDLLDSQKGMFGCRLSEDEAFYI